MASIAPALPVSDSALQRTDVSPAPSAEDKRPAERARDDQPNLTPDDLHVRLDAEAQRFVQTLTDAQTAETVRRYPSEEQLAYSRAVMAYLRAMIES